jgi:predicted nucleotidyltransferase
MSDAITPLFQAEVPAACELLVFGSSLRGSEATDVDVLIVYGADGRLGALRLRDQLEGDAELGLVHVTMLTLDEEADAQFAKEVGAVHVAGDALVTL